MITALKNKSDEAADVGELRFEPGKTIPLSRIPQVYDGVLFGAVVADLFVSRIVGVDVHGSEMLPDDAIYSLNILFGEAKRTTAFTYDELLQVIRDEIDAKTQELIVAGYTYGGLTFPCPIDQQMNFKATFDMRSLLTYPFKVKGKGQTFLFLQNQSEVFDWFMTGFQHVHGNLQNGWQMKDDVAELSLEELMAYSDPRSA